MRNSPERWRGKLARRARPPERSEVIAPSLDEFFSGYDESRVLFDALRSTVAEVAPAQIKVGKSQVSFRRERAFAFAWEELGA